ncbi:MAG: hypothetical protein ABIQ40_19025 [Bacteroidia bacterium]
MEHEELNEWIRRYRTYILNLHEPKYFSNPNRDKYIVFFQDRALRFYLAVGEDIYRRKINDLYTEGNFLQEPLPEILKKIESARIHYTQQKWAGIEYGFDYYDVGKLAERTDQRIVLKYLALCEIADFFIQFTSSLRKAIKRGAIGMQEEKDLFAKAKQGILPDKKERPQPLVGFFWEGGDVTMRIRTLYEGLISGEFIEKKTTLEIFSTLFKGVPIAERVKWCGSVSQLVYLMGGLYDRNLLGKSDELKAIQKQDIKSEQAYGRWLYPKLSACFINKNDKRLQGKNLKFTKSDIRNKERLPAKGVMLQNLVQKVVKATFLNSIEQEKE